MIKVLIVIYLVGVAVFAHQFYRFALRDKHYPMSTRIITALLWPALLFLVFKDWVSSLWKARHYRRDDDDQA